MKVTLFDFLWLLALLARRSTLIHTLKAEFRFNVSLSYSLKLTILTNIKQKGSNKCVKSDDKMIRKMKKAFR